MIDLRNFFRKRLVFLFGLIAFSALSIALFLSIYISNSHLNKELLKSTQESNATLTRIFTNEIYPEIQSKLAKIEQNMQSDSEYQHHYESINNRIRTFVQDTDILKIKVLSTNGLTIYSTDPKQLEADYSQNIAFKKALKGELSSELTLREKFSTISGQVFDRHLISSYVPVTINGEITAVIELYSDRSSSIKRSEEVLQNLLKSLPIIFILVFALLLQSVRYLDSKRREQNRKLDKANNAKSEFLATMSHEIRTPLNGVIATLSMIDKSTLSDENKELIDTAMHSSELLTVVINDILDYSKIEANKLELQAKPFSIQTLIKQIEHSYRPMIEDKGLKFIVQTTTLPNQNFIGDAIRIKQILNNYLNNAFKFTSEGSIKLNYEALSADTLKFSVTDTGIGIDAKGVEKLFNKFSQIESGSQRSFTGTGLGLSICKNLAELMNGSVGVDSIPGKGSTFWVKIQLHPTQQSIDETQTTANKSDIKLSKKSKVLIVEDNPVNQLIVQKLLKAFGIDYETANNGQECLEYFKNHTADLVLMDCQMPVMNGFIATEELRKQSQKLPIIALTANAQESDKQACLQAGMDDFLSKPFKKDALMEILEKHLKA